MNEQPLSRREARDRERLLANGVETAEKPAEIVVTDIPDIENLSLILPESGAVLTTGAIELPWLKSDDSVTAVAEAATVEAASNAESADMALANTMESEQVSGIEPRPARTHIRSRKKASVFPNRLRQGWGAVHMVAVSGFVLFTVLVALIGAVLLGAIRL